MENNGKGSRTKQTKHIRVPYLFMKDIIKKRDISVKYCSTKEMISDYFTKVLRVHYFRSYGAEIQGGPADDTNYSIPPSHGIDGRNDNKTSKGCVGGDVNFLRFNNKVNGNTMDKKDTPGALGHSVTDVK